MELHKNQINSGVGFVFFLFSKIQKLLFLFKLVVVGLHLHITQLWNFEVCVFVVSKKIKKTGKKKLCPLFIVCLIKNVCQGISKSRGLL